MTGDIIHEVCVCHIRLLHIDLIVDSKISTEGVPSESMMGSKREQTKIRHSK